jgi:hypothetical protein
MLVLENSDMSSKNQFVAGLALAALGDVGSVIMVWLAYISCMWFLSVVMQLRTLASEVESKMSHSSAFIRKKARLF